jgi:hypothetical protein
MLTVADDIPPCVGSGDADAGLRRRSLVVGGAGLLAAGERNYTSNCRYHSGGHQHPSPR